MKTERERISLLDHHTHQVIVKSWAETRTGHLLACVWVNTGGMLGPLHQPELMGSSLEPRKWGLLRGFPTRPLCLINP